MVCLIAAALLTMVQVRRPLPDAWLLLAGLLFLLGFAVSVVTGMLCKIVPFLAWFHLQARLGYGPGQPSMRDYLPEARARGQFRCTWPPSPACWRRPSCPGSPSRRSPAGGRRRLAGMEPAAGAAPLSTDGRGWLLGASRLIMASHRQVISQLSNSCT